MQWKACLVMKPNSAIRSNKITKLPHCSELRPALVSSHCSCDMQFCPHPHSDPHSESFWRSCVMREVRESSTVRRTAIERSVTYAPPRMVRVQLTTGGADQDAPPTAPSKEAATDQLQKPTLEGWTHRSTSQDRKCCVQPIPPGVFIN